MDHRPRLCLVTPALASANNGNWQTADRWGRWLAADYAVRTVQRWDGAPADAMIALHAGRSADSIAAWAGLRPRRPLLLVLTGTDLYRDILGDPAAQRSLDAADTLVVLNELGAQALPARLRDRCHVVLQSVSARATLDKPTRLLRTVMVGHLRDVKDPLTYLRAAERLAARQDIRLDHVGAALDPALADAALRLQAVQPRYRWLGALSHGATRLRIQRAHVLVHPSRMEGGAHVVIEALRSGTPVLASRIPGNTGLLGQDWPGLFEPGDDAGLAALIERCRDDAAMLARLKAQGSKRAPLFEPARERADLLGLVARLLQRNER